MQGRYYKWYIQVKKIVNFKEVCHVSGLAYSEDSYYDDYITGGEGYLMEQHAERLTHKEKEKELCGN